MITIYTCENVRTVIVIIYKQDVLDMERLCFTIIYKRNVIYSVKNSGVLL